MSCSSANLSQLSLLMLGIVVMLPFNDFILFIYLFIPVESSSPLMPFQCLTSVSQLQEVACGDKGLKQVSSMCNYYRH